MSKIDLTKKWSVPQYQDELEKLGIHHFSRKQNTHDSAYCGWCEHSSLAEGSAYLGGWFMQSVCAFQDNTPVSEFCHCKNFVPTKSKEYRKNNKKVMRSLDKWHKEKNNG